MTDEADSSGPIGELAVLVRDMLAGGERCDCDWRRDLGSGY